MASSTLFLTVFCFFLLQKDVHGATSGLYGITGPGYSDGPNSLVQFNTQTGVSTTVVAGNEQIGTSESLGALDYINGIYYVVIEDIGGNTALYPYDLTNPSNQIDTIPLPMISSDKLIGAGEAIVSNPLTGDIYVFGRNFSQNLEYMVKVSRDSTTQEVSTTIINTYENINTYPLLSGNPNIYDSKRDAIWITAEVGDSTRDDSTQLVYFDAKTGNILNQVAYTDLPINTAQYDPNNDAIVGLVLSGEVNGNYSYTLKWVDPVTFAVTKTFDPINNWCDWSSVNNLDIVNDIGYYMIFTNPYGSCATQNGTFTGHIVSVDINTGKLIDGPAFCQTQYENCPYDFVYYNQ